MVGFLNNFTDSITGNDVRSAQFSANKTNKQIARENVAHQKEFAQMGVRWRVADAKAAGIHPLYALGAQTQSFSPVHAGVQPVTGGMNADRMLDFADTMGQFIGRGQTASVSPQEKQIMQLQLAGAQADVEGKMLENQYKGALIRQLTSPGTPPGVPNPRGTAHEGLGGQNLSGVKVKPSETTSTIPGQPSQEAAVIPDTAWARDYDGGLIPVASKDVKERIEDSFVPEMMHAYRNNFLPNIGSGPVPPDSMLPTGARSWKWDHFKQNYKPDTYFRKRYHFPSRS